jgi:acyl-CoA synthetase (AMP-forming)/AMP-acid ligase II
MIHCGPALELPDSPLHEFVLRDAAARGDHPALVDAETGESVSYGRLHELVERAAATLAGTGLGKGSVLAVCAPNSTSYPAACLAASRVGAAVLPVNPLSTPRELAAMLLDAGATHLVVGPQQAAAVSPGELPATVREVFVCGADAAGYQNLLCPGPGPAAPAPGIDQDSDVAVLAYSGGTTGTPKGVMLTHRNITANIAQMCAVIGVTPEHRVLAVLPFSHIYGFSALMGVALRSGSTLVVMTRFDIMKFLAAISEHRITHVLVAPPIVAALARHPAVASYDLSSLRQVLCAAAPLSPGIAEAARGRTGVHVTQAFGMTELSPSVLVTPAAEIPPPGSVGKPLPRTECRLVSAGGADAGPDTDGELWVRGPQVMKGYLGSAEATDVIIDVDGWLHTGDIARADSHGWFYITGRVKELIKYKGYQVAPAELEAVLLRHPRIADAAVVGVPDQDGNELPAAFVVPAPAGPGTPELTEEEVIAHVAVAVAPYKKIRLVEFIDQVPRSIAGKILRRELRLSVM